MSNHWPRGTVQQGRSMSHHEGLVQQHQLCLSCRQRKRKTTGFSLIRRKEREKKKKRLFSSVLSDTYWQLSPFQTREVYTALLNPKRILLHSWRPQRSCFETDGTRKGFAGCAGSSWWYEISQKMYFTYTLCPATLQVLCWVSACRDWVAQKVNNLLCPTGMDVSFFFFSFFLP